MLKQTNFGDDGFPSDVLVDVRPRAGAGLRERLEHGLRSAIQQQRLVAGTALPPTRVLAAELGISRSVVVAAYANLRADGYIEARRGSGTRVRLDAQHGAPRPPRANGWDYRAIYFAHPRDTSTLGVPPIRLGGGEPDPALFPRRQWVRHYRAVLTELPDPDLTYPSALGVAALRHALSAYLGRVRGVATTPERMLVCGGVTQGLTLICRALRRGGASRVAVENPCLGLHRKAIAMTGLEPVPVPGDAGGLDIDALAGHDADAVLVAPAHSYPIGGTLDARRRYDLVEWARRHDALVIEDDYDAEFRYDRLPVGALQGLAPDHVAYLGSASKTVSPSLRLGWVAAPPTLIDALEQEKRFDDMGSSLLEQLAFARFIDGGDFSRHLRRVRPIYRSRRDTMIEALAQRLPEVHWQGASAGLHLHVTLPEGIDQRALTYAAYKRGVLVEPTAWHWAEPEQAPPSLVLGYGTASAPAIRRGIALLRATLLETSRASRQSGSRRSSG
jgi:GntR family transcriptional regulator / MocR family aminotransferase